MLQTVVFFSFSSCQNTANTGVFGWFALGDEATKVKKTPVFTFLVRKTLQKQCFLRICQKTV